METTTQALIHDRFRLVIEAIQPIYEYLQDVPWRFVEELPGEVSGSQTRLFSMDMEVGGWVPDGLHTTGEEYSFRLDIHVAYGSLPTLIAPWLITQDGDDLRTVLQAQLAPTLPGLLAVEPVAFAPVSTEPGHWYGTHVFEIHYIHDTRRTTIPDV